MFNMKKFDLLVSVYIFCVVASELMGGKTFYLFSIGSYHLNASVAILLLPFVYTINDVIVETFGKARAQSLVRSSIFVIVLLVLFSLAATALPPSTRFLPTEKAYDTIFKISIRFSLASLTAFILAEFADVYIFSKLRQRLGKKVLWFRTNLSNILSQFIDTSVFMILAFYALDKSLGANMSFIFSLVLPYWLLKCLMSLFETPFAYLGVAWLRRGDGKNED
ncbi:MAG: queuosine precursor transporter [Patescibacteria group bacterium]|jgi:hypothetical protein